MFSREELIEKLNYFRQLPGETEWLEFKEAKTNFDSDDLGKYFSALSNEANLKNQSSAWLIFGIRDKKPRVIVGSSFRQEPVYLNKLKQEIVQGTSGLTFQEIYELPLPEGRVILFQIPSAPRGMPTSWKGHFYGRNGESLGALSIHELEEIRRQIAPDWSAEICPNATLEHLDETAVAVAREKFLKKHPEERISKSSKTWDAMTFLEKARLTKDGKITRTAILLLGKPEAAHHVNPHPAQITWKLDADKQAYAHFGPPFLLTTEQVFKSIRTVRFRIQPRDKLIPIELATYTSNIILEALNNCIAHQDYAQNARIIVVEKTDRVVFQNVGRFFDGAVADYVLRERTPEFYRNPFLVQAMVHLDMIDTMGMGIRRMFLEQRNRYFPLPEYDLSKPNNVCVTIYGALIDENYTRTLIDHHELSLPEVILLDKIQKKHKVLKEDAALLRKKNLVEGRYPNLFVSAGIAETTDQRAKYLKLKAFDEDYYEKLLTTFFQQYKCVTRQEIDELLIDKLPDILSPKQKKTKVGNLITKLRQKRLIENRGPNKRPKWFMIKDSA